MLIDGNTLATLAHETLPNTDFIGVFSNNNLPQTNKSSHTTMSLIVNTHTGNLGGEHWFALVCYPNGYGEVFDSYGLRPSPRIERWMNQYCNEGWLYQQRFLQGPLSTLCGYYCLYFLQRRLCMYPYLSPLTSFINKHFDWSTEQNDAMIKRVYKLN